MTRQKFRPIFIAKVVLGYVDKTNGLRNHTCDSGDLLICYHAEGIEWELGCDSCLASELRI